MYQNSHATEYFFVAQITIWFFKIKLQNYIKRSIYSELVTTRVFPALKHFQHDWTDNPGVNIIKPFLITKSSWHSCL